MRDLLARALEPAAISATRERVARGFWGGPRAADARFGEVVPLRRMRSGENEAETTFLESEEGADGGAEALQDD
jgi:hypothetical protein